MDVLLNGRVKKGAGRIGGAIVLRAQQLIERCIGDPDLSVSRIAEELNISVSVLRRALQVEGTSAMRYAWILRLKHAARLLENAPHGAIQEVAYQCGFTSTAHFSRAFKSRFGMTPREYATRPKELHEIAPEANEDPRRGHPVIPCANSGEEN